MAHEEQTLQKLLNKIVTELQYENPEFIIKEISSGGANYSSKLFTVVLKGDNKEDLYLFSKVIAFGEKLRAQAGPAVSFDSEQYAYTELLTKYAAIEEENGVPEEHRLYFAKCYGVDPTLYQETMVLENLFAHGYGDFDRFHSMDWEYATSATTSLAKMHALSFALSERYPEEFQRFLLTRFTMDWAAVKPMMDKSVQTALKTIKPEYKQALETFFDTYSSDINVAYAPVRKRTIVHGDFRGSNLMHKVLEDGKVDIKIVDLQTLQGGSPVTDLMYFIFTGSDEQFRAQYYDKLIDHYYTQLSAAMMRLNLDPEETFSRADFDYELEQKLPFGLTLAVFTLPVVTVESENAPKVNENLEMSDFSVEKTSDLYAERLNGIVKDFVKWGILK